MIIESRPIEKRIRRLAEQVEVPRARFLEYFDQFLVRKSSPNEPSNALEAIYIARQFRRERNRKPLDATKTSAAIALSLSSFRSPDVLAEFLLAARTDNIFVMRKGVSQKNFDLNFGQLLNQLLDTGRLDFNKEKTSDHDAARLSLQALNHEALTSLQNIWMTADKLLPALTRLQRKVCRVRILDDVNRLKSVSQGTGLLVGPAAVLTNYHVVEAAINNRSKLRDVRVEFHRSMSLHRDENVRGEIYRLADIDEAILDSSLNHDDGNMDSNEAWWMVEEKRSSWMTSIAGKLDYAILRLSETPGAWRGFCDLQEILSNPPASERSQEAWVFHHPLDADSTVISKGGVAFQQAGADRIFHGASTAKGSSGGLIMNEDAKPIGLHYGSLQLTGDDEPDFPHNIANLGVDLHGIAKSVQANGKINLVKQTPNFQLSRSCLSDGKPVFGRNLLFRDITALFEGDADLLVIDSSNVPDRWKKPGKSFSVEILRSLFSDDGNIFIVMSAEAIPARAVELARHIVRQIAPELNSIERLDEDTTTAAMIERYVNAIELTLQQRASNSTVWMVIDDLDKFALPDTDVRDLLSELYRRSNQLSSLKIVLIGLSERQSIGGFPESVRFSVISERDVTERAKLFEDWFRRRSMGGGELSDLAIDFVSSIAASLADTEAPLQDLSKLVVEHVHPTIGELLNEGGT